MKRQSTVENKSLTLNFTNTKPSWSLQKLPLWDDRPTSRLHDSRLTATPLWQDKETKYVLVTLSISVYISHHWSVYNETKANMNSHREKPHKHSHAVRFIRRHAQLDLCSANTKDLTEFIWSFWNLNKFRKANPEKLFHVNRDTATKSNSTNLKGNKFAGAVSKVFQHASTITGIGSQRH